MQIYHRSTDLRWLCGRWNNSPVEIGYCHYFEVPKEEVFHSHPKLHEYYIPIVGKGTLKVEEKIVSLAPNTVVMVQPNERHKVLSIELQPLIFIVIKSLSLPNNKVIHPEPDRQELPILASILDLC